MSPERWQRIEEVFQAACALPASEREVFIATQCSGDTTLRREVESLLASESRRSDFLDKSAAELFGDALDSAAHSLQGKRIGPYRLVRRLGAGGMGTVWLAERDDEQFELKVAIKLIRGGMDWDDLLARFRRERQVLANLAHPNIARLLDGGMTEDGRPFLVMEYVDGMPIDQWCDRKRLSIADRLKLFRCVCAAVQFAHRNLVVHRDLKPSNILIDAQGEPKLLDFGIAKVLDDEADDELHDMTLPTQRRFTPAYASPELVRGEPITTAADVYSLGVILYELLSGQRPYHVEATSAAHLERIIVEQQPTRPSSAALQRRAQNGERKGSAGEPKDGGEIAALRQTDVRHLRRQLAGDLDVIVLTALRKEPERRYASVEQLSEDIRRHLEQLPVSARAESLAYRTSKFVRRNAAAVGAAVFMIVGLIAATFVSTTLYVQAEAAKEDAQAAERDAQEERDRATRDLVKQRAVRTFLTLLLGDVRRGESVQQPTAVHEALDRRTAGIGRGNVALDPDIEASVLVAAGELYRWLDQPERAMEQYEAAIAKLERMPGAHRDLGEALVMFGQACVEANRPEDAIEMLTRAIELQTRPESKSDNVHIPRIWLAEALIAENRLDEAKRQLELAEPITARFYRDVADRAMQTIRERRGGQASQ